jgi:PLD-like domain
VPGEPQRGLLGGMWLPGLQHRALPFKPAITNSPDYRLSELRFLPKNGHGKGQLSPCEGTRAGRRDSRNLGYKLRRANWEQKSNWIYAMLVLLRENEVGERFCQLKKNASEAVVAVPFWGKGSPAMLDLISGQPSRIICNLNSAACNPYVIQELKEAHGVTVRSHPRLHAKIYATSTFAIIGSSNASTNGLIEGTPTSWIEANVLTNDVAMVTKTLALFQELWDNQETSEVTKGALSDAIALWNARPKQKPHLAATSLLAACREQPDLFKSVYLAAYDTDLGKKGKKKEKAFKAAMQPGQSGLKEKICNSWLMKISRSPSAENGICA